MKNAPSVEEVNPEVKCQQLCISVDDTENDDLLQSFQTGVEFIQGALESEGVVLGHCIAGVSRSCTVRFASVGMYFEGGGEDSGTIWLLLKDIWLVKEGARGE